MSTSQPRREPTREAWYRGTHPLCAGDIRQIAKRLDELGYPDECPAEVMTPLPPKNRRIVDMVVRDYSTPTTTEGTNTT